MNISRTRFKQQIVSEFVDPNPKIKTKGVIILCMGTNVPKKDELLEFYSRKGYWVFFPRYRGTWESSGLFLRTSPHQDILDVLNEIPKGFKDLQTGRMVNLPPSALRKVCLVGTSFGGAAAILASRHSAVHRVVLICPVTDWRRLGRKGSFDLMIPYMKDAFGRALRGRMSDWNKLRNGEFYSPAAVAHSIDGSKLLIFHAKDDEVVSIAPSVDFAERTGATMITLEKGGHIGSLILTDPKTHKAVSRFFK